ncbi:hypothetical protein NTGM5_130052 [Candidatus Nitrotoga sp. M5]|nr:hypothetical protein NTGM5_130052 [Candidatus Nitrotoga sp. M5]
MNIYRRRTGQVGTHISTYNAAQRGVILFIKLFGNTVIGNHFYGCVGMLLLLPFVDSYLYRVSYNFIAMS